MLRKIQNSMMTPGRLAKSAGRGFTLMEMMVGVGAIALVAVGLAAIFDSVGKTVSGGRRVSVVNTYAGLIESQLRRDFANMNRDGFLIIRNQWVDRNNNGSFEYQTDVVPVSPDQEAKDIRGHRIDEIEFVVTGKYRSSRQPIKPDVQAESNTAVVYLGHGLIGPEAGTIDATTGFKKALPRIDGRYPPPTPQPFGAPGGTGPANLNQYCGNWMLLRQVTLLANPESAQSLPVPPTTDVYGNMASTPNGYHRLRNRPTQFMLQPAVSSMFRSLAEVFPSPANGAPNTNAPNWTLRASAITTESNYPCRASGLVDIATSSLADIRATVNTYPYLPAAFVTNWPEAPNRTMAPAQAVAAPARPAPASYEEIDRMHALMNDLMPTESRNQYSVAAHNDVAVSPMNATWGTRIRYEEGPTDLLAAISGAATTPTAQLAQAQRRADQLMLSASNFVPHCTDFHVEWSFGKTDSYGQTVWHGLPTPRSYYYQAIPGSSLPAEEPLPYPNTSIQTSDNRQYPYVLEVGTGTVTHEVSPRLIYGFTPSGGEAELTSYFGWIDPTYAPPTVPVDGMTTGVVPWAWPKLVRVTITMVDPIDPTIESTFQYIFDVPEKQGPKAQ